MYILIFYVPESHLERVKNAVFKAGAGAIGDYSRCSWQVKGTGQFQPGEQSSPFLGSRGSLEEIPEYRVEVACPDERVEDIAGAFLREHPYEEPAHHFMKVKSASELTGSGDAG